MTIVRPIVLAVLVVAFGSPLAAADPVEVWAPDVSDVVAVNPREVAYLVWLAEDRAYHAWDAAMRAWREVNETTGPLLDPAGGVVERAWHAAQDPIPEIEPGDRDCRGAYAREDDRNNTYLHTDVVRCTPTVMHDPGMGAVCTMLGYETCCDTVGGSCVGLLLAPHSQEISNEEPIPFCLGLDLRGEPSLKYRVGQSCREYPSKDVPPPPPP